MPISLPAAQQETYSKGGVTVENNTATALIQAIGDFTNHQVQFTFSQGTPADNTFVPGARSTHPTLSIDMLTGIWTASTGQTGILSVGHLTSLNNNQRNLRNAIENIANANNIFLGTVVAWT